MWWTFGLFPSFGYYEKTFYEYSLMQVFWQICDNFKMSCTMQWFHCFSALSANSWYLHFCFLFSLLFGWFRREKEIASLFYHLLLYNLFFSGTTYRILVPQMGMGSMPAVKAWSLNHWTARSPSLFPFKAKNAWLV